jgi:hypothetical protein
MSPHFYLASPLGPHPMSRWSDETLKSRQLWYHSEIHGVLFCKVKSSPRWHTGLWTLKTGRHGWFGQQWRIDSPNLIFSGHLCAPVLPAPHYPGPHFTEKSSSQDKGTILQLLSLGWLSWYSNRPGRSCLGLSKFKGLW